MAQAVNDAFAELKPALARDEALAEANRCLFCYDAPCMRACPTHIDVPGFIKKIATDNVRGSAAKILDANILGASCARVCPTEVLCEGVCVLNDMHHRPIQIGRLQRYATDWAMTHGMKPFTKGARRAGKVAVVGGGPAGLACAAELEKHGVTTTVFDAAAQPGGLNTYGVAEYKMTPKTALEEVKWLTDAGVDVKSNVRVGKDIQFAELEKDYDAIFLGVGLGKIGKLDVPGADLPGVVDALDFIEELKTKRDQATKKYAGKRVAVVGGGNTSIDCVTQAIALGAAEVHLIYRRGPAEMPAYKHEQEHARALGCRFVFGATTKKIFGSGKVEGIELTTGTLAVDFVIASTGQEKLVEFFATVKDLKLDKGRVVVDESGKTSNPKYYAGGDCISGGKEVVNAVAEGKRAALAIVNMLLKKEVARG